MHNDNNDHENRSLCLSVQHDSMCRSFRTKGQWFKGDKRLERLDVYLDLSSSCTSSFSVVFKLFICVFSLSVLDFKIKYPPRDEN